MDEQMQQTQSNIPQPEAPKTNMNDNEKHKPLAIVGYIIPFLFFVPLLSDAKNNAYAKFHANQQLDLLLAAIAVNVVGGVIPILGWFIILPLGSIALIVLAIMGIMHAAKGEMKALPMIGGFSLIK